MRIVFVGTVEFSRHCLQAVLRAGGDVVAVVTLHAEDARFNADYADLAAVADPRGIPVHHVRKLKDPETLALVRALQPDVVFVFGISQLVPPEMLSIPARGSIGVHPSLLPKGRGRHPLIWALVDGLSESGLTFFYMDAGADSGDILWQRPFPITLQDDAASLYEKIKVLADQAIAEFVPQLAAGTAPRSKQNDEAATYWRKRSEADGEIDWGGPTMRTYNLIRALTRPYPGAHTFHDGERIVVWRSRVAKPETALTARPGEIVATTDGRGLLIKTGDGVLEIVEWQGDRSAPLGPGAFLGRQP